MIFDLFRNEGEFSNVHGYDEIKDIVRRALEAEDSYNLLFIGPPAKSSVITNVVIPSSKSFVQIFC